MTKTIKVLFASKRLVCENTAAAKELYDKSSYGSLSGGLVELSPLEALHLLHKNIISVSDSKNKEVSFEDFYRKVARMDKRLFVRYPVFRDFRQRGYVIKTALKFGADFRVYDRGIKPGQAHAKWIVFPVKESDMFSWHEFSAKNRVAHSTKKNLLIAVVDDEQDVSYWEVSWVKP